MENKLNPNIHLERYKGRLNWGAFFLGIFWALAHRVYLWAVLALFLGLPINLVLLFIGNEVALKNRQFKDEEEFISVQKAWTKWGIIVFIVSTAFTILAIILGLILGGKLLKDMRNMWW